MTRVLYLLLLCMVSCSIAEDNGDAGLFLRENALETLVEPYGRDSLRVRIGRKIERDHPGGLLPIKSSSSAHDEAKLLSASSYINGNLRADVGSDGLLTFTRVSDAVILFSELLRDFTALPNTTNSFMLNSSFSSDSNEAFYGLGEHKTGKLNYKGLFFDFESCLEYPKSTGSEIMIPWVISNRGYGVLWNLPSYGNVAFNSNNTSWTSFNTPQLDIWVTTSKPFSKQVTGDILSNYVDATGHAPKIPYFATGFWQSKNRYRSQSEIINVTEGYLQRGLPLSVIVIDWYHWIHLGDWSFNPACWPNPSIMSTELSKVGVNIMVTVWPLVQNTSVNFQTMHKNEYFIKCPADNCYPGAYIYDPTNPKARAYVFEQVKKGYYNNGIKVYWLDAAEPELQEPYPQMTYSIGPDTAVGMMFPVFHQTTFYEGLKGLGETEWIFLSRSAWVGSQRFGTAVWSGDIDSTFESLQQQVRVGLNMGMSGIVWWTTDIGGYRGGNITDPQWQELIVRWFQWGAFCPLFRIHGDRLPSEPNDPTCGFSGGSNEVWNFGDQAYAAITTVMNMREQLRPYIKEQMDVAAFNGTPVMRPLWFDFPGDVNCTSIEDQYMFGPDFMVAPILQYQARSRSVYFPSGANWLHWFTKTEYKGGMTVANFPAPLNQFPVFIRL